MTAEHASGSDRHSLILVIEDELAISSFLCDFLEEQGYHCISANSADSALQLLKTIRPALITLDLGLPGVSGRTLLQLLRAQRAYADIPVIIISAEHSIEAPLREASQAVITKPFELDQLLTAVSEVLAAQAPPTQEQALGAADTPNYLMPEQGG